jgi:hypothetical protein
LKNNKIKISPESSLQKSHILDWFQDSE